MKSNIRNQLLKYLNEDRSDYKIEELYLLCRKQYSHRKSKNVIIILLRLKSLSNLFAKGFISSEDYLSLQSRIMKNLVDLVFEEEAITNLNLKKK